MYISALLILWTSVISSFAGDWARTRVAFILDNSSTSTVIAALNAPLAIPWRITGLVAIVTSDAILVRLILCAQPTY